MRKRIIDEPEDIQKIEKEKREAIKKVSAKYDSKIDKLNVKYQKNALTEIKILNANFNKITKTHDSWVGKKPADFKQQVAGRFNIIMKIFAELDDRCIKTFGHHLWELSPKTIDDLTTSWGYKIPEYKNNIESYGQQNNQPNSATYQQNQVANGTAYNQNQA